MPGDRQGKPHYEVTRAMTGRSFVIVMQTMRDEGSVLDANVAESCILHEYGSNVQ
jgi:hypothetical protein